MKAPLHPEAQAEARRRAIAEAPAKVAAAQAAAASSNSVAALKTQVVELAKVVELLAEELAVDAPPTVTLGKKTP